MPVPIDETPRFSALPPAVRAVWAKSSSVDQPAGHGLLAHMLDVSAVAEALLQRESPASLQWAARQFGMSHTDVARWLATLVGLHDFGKAIAGFQDKWPQGRQADEAAGLTFPTSVLAWGRHDLASAFELSRLLSTLAGSPVRAQSLANAVAAHHGYLFQSNEIRQAVRPGEPRAWQDARRVLFNSVVATLAPQACTTQDEPALPALAWLAGLTAVSDWIGSNTDWFAPGERDETLAGHHSAARRLAEQALDNIGWPAHHTLLQQTMDADAIVARLVGSPGVTARPLQRSAERLLQGLTDPPLLIVEAPMGEGKTELAFLAHLRLQATLHHRGLFIGLPTQATGNAMFERTLAFLRAFGATQPLDIQLAHGGVHQAAPDSLLRLRGIHGDVDDPVRSSAWFSQRRRPLLSPYGVGTLDQALLASLNAKHHFVRVWGLAHRVVVLDEVHAYDTYTSGLIDAMLRWLHELGCSVVLMSATLPAARRRGLLRAWGCQTDAPADIPYPRVSVVSGGGVRAEHVPSRPQASITVSAIDESLDSIAARAEALAREGGCGAVVVNTVDRAQQLYTRLQTRLADRLQPLLFHARVPADQRQDLERAVLATFGRDADRPPAALLVATQVVEQSLDIDFDWMLTDLAPVDLMLQRAGRLHRHTRPRPAAHATPGLTVAGLQADRLPDLKGTRWGFYDSYVMYRSWAFASRAGPWRMPQDIDHLVQQVYGDAELPPDLDEHMRAVIEVAAYGRHLADTDRSRLLAQYAAIDARHTLSNAYVQLPRGNEEGDFGNRNVTRLGPESLNVVPVHVGSDGWRLHATQVAFDPTLPPGPTLATQLVQRQLRLSRHDVVQALRDTEPPAGWAEHPWLRHLKVLQLVDGACTLGDTRIVLDPVLGLVFGSLGTGSRP
jgi:CRISPR-associated endonuclease/helicase Cas3